MVRAASFVLAALILCQGGIAVAQDAAPRAVLTGGLTEYAVRHGDTLTSVSARFGTGMDALRELNHLDRRAVLRDGQTIIIDNRHIATIDGGSRVSINIAQRMLYLAEGESVLAYPIAVGRRDWPTPVGAFTVIEKEENPTWDVPVSIQQEMRQQGKAVITQVPASPQNPLGAHWIRLSFPGLGIHGTIAPESIYRYASHGCIRMHPDDVAQLFARVAPGTAGAIRYQPVVIAMIEGRVFVEAHPDVYRRGPDPMEYVRTYAQTDGFAQDVDWDAAAAVLRQARGLAVDVTKEDPPSIGSSKGPSVRATEAAQTPTRPVLLRARSRREWSKSRRSHRGNPAPAFSCATVQ